MTIRSKKSSTYRWRRAFFGMLTVWVVLAALSGCSLFRGKTSRPEPVSPLPASSSAVSAAAVPSIWPLGPDWRQISSPFGVKRGRSRAHKGIDILAPKGSPVTATADGEVIFSGYSGRYGRMVVLQHAGGRQTAYAHLDACTVSTGKKVRQGEVIGRVGRTGNATTTHLHYEVREKGQPVNPARFLP